MANFDSPCASLFTVGFAGTTPSKEVLELIDRGVFGVILFGRNVESAEQVAELVAALKRHAGSRPLLVSIDQEGGRVARLRERHGFTELPPMRALGDTGDEALSGRSSAASCARWASTRTTRPAWTWTRTRRTR